MPRPSLRLLVSFLAGLAVVGVAAAAWIEATEPTMDFPGSLPVEGRTAPDFRLETIDGETFHLEAHRGTVVVLNFWATWCPPCRREIPDFVSLQKDLAGDVQFVGIALERSDAPEAAVRQFAQNMGINYPVGVGDGAVAQAYGGVNGLPTTYVIGPDGRIRGHIPGMATEGMLRPGLRALVRE